MSKRKREDDMSKLSGGIILIGIGIIFLADLDFFPWILAVAGLASLPGSVAAEGLWAGLQGFVWMGGLAILFALDLIWPGILLLIGASMIVGALVKPPMLGKPKRGLPDESAPDEFD